MDNDIHTGITTRLIEEKILTIRGQQVLLDKDLAELYGIETKVLNQAVKRNINRFPIDFMFQLTPEECLRSQIATSNAEKTAAHTDEYADNQTEGLRSQIVTSNERGGRRYAAYAFTENGIAMLSSVLRSDTAIEVNIGIMRAFTAMRHFLATNMQVLQRMETMEYHQLEMKQHQIEADKRIDDVFKQLDAYKLPAQGIFFDGQVYDAYLFISDLIKQAKHEITLIDNYIDETVLTQLDKRCNGVSATIFTLSISKQLKLDITKHNEQYRPIIINTFRSSHDRFICIDDKVYHIGASLKDLGKKWFAFALLEDLSTDTLIKKIEK